MVCGFSSCIFSSLLKHVKHIDINIYKCIIRLRELSFIAYVLVKHHPTDITYNKINMQQKEQLSHTLCLKPSLKTYLTCGMQIYISFLFANCKIFPFLLNALKFLSRQPSCRVL